MITTILEYNETANIILEHKTSVNKRYNDRGTAIINTIGSLFLGVGAGNIIKELKYGTNN